MINSKGGEQLKAYNNDKGIALLMVLLLLVIVGVLAGSLLTSYTSDIKLAANNADKNKAFHAAEGGVNYLEDRLYILNTEENELDAFYIGRDPFDQRYKKVVSEIEKLEEDNLKILDFDIFYNIPPEKKTESSFVVEVIASNGSISEEIEVTYKLASKGLAFFAHTLAARSIEMNGYKLSLKEDFPDSDSYSFIATAESSTNSNISHSNIDLLEDNGWWFFENWEKLTGSKYNKAYENTFQFYGDGDEQLYLPEDEDSGKFKDYVRSINFREVLKQNNINEYVLDYDEEGNPLNTVPLSQFKIKSENDDETLYDITKINPEMDSNKLNLAEGFDFPKDLNGYYIDFDNFRDKSNINTGPYIYIKDFDFSSRKNEIDFTDINTVKNNQNETGVVQLYIDDDIDFSNTSSNLYFASKNKKSILVQSGGDKINLDNNRILYYSSGNNGKINSIAYYAPNAEMSISGNMPGDGWGQSYNVKKIILEDDVTFPPMVYDPEKSGLYGNIHPDIGGYFEEGDEKAYTNKAPGEVFRTNWRTD
jgi:hypothetical protein